MNTNEQDQEHLLYKSVNKQPLIDLFKNQNKPPTGKTHAIVDEESSDILAFCSNWYQLRKNEEVFKPFEQLLSENKIRFNKEIKIIEGNKFYVNYIILSKVKSSIVDGILPLACISNSYDGTVKTQIKFGYYKLLCRNKLSRPVDCKIHTSSKHSTDENEFSSQTIPFFFVQLKQFLQKTEDDMEIFERLKKTKSNSSILKQIASSIKLSKEAKIMAEEQLTRIIEGNLTYINENGDKVKSNKSDITLFAIYNACNYAIYHTNPKELPEFKLKRDMLLIEKICGI